MFVYMYYKISHTRTSIHTDIWVQLVHREDMTYQVLLQMNQTYKNIYILYLGKQTVLTGIIL